MSRKLFPVSIVASAVALSLVGGDALALGLGGLRVQSALNQPFVGEIDLLDVKPDELDTVKTRLASSQEFGKVGARRFHYLTNLRFSPQISPRGDTVIRVTSREPMREPYMDFLIETIWPQGRLVREYTVLLDPPVTASGRARRVAPPVSSRPAPQRAQPPRRTAPAPERRAPPPAPVAYEPGYPLRIGPVRPGAGLWRLSVQNKPPGATVAQTAMALYRNNQGAFIRGDINRLLVSKTLTIPSSAELFALGPDAAQREFQAALRGRKVRRAPITPVPSGAPSDDARLRIAGASEPRPTAPAASGPSPEQMAVDREMEQELLLAREVSESARQETAELRTRIRDLENQLAEIQKLLQLRNAELARIQGAEPPAASAPAGEEPSAIEPVPEAPAQLPPEVMAAIAAAEQSVAGGPETAGAGTPASEPSPVQETPTQAPSGKPDEPKPKSVTAAVEKPEPVEETGAGMPEVAPAAAPEPTTKPGRFASTDTPAEKGFPWQMLLLPAAGLVGIGALGVGVFAWLRARRRRTEEEVGLESNAFAEDSPFGSLSEESGARAAGDSQDVGQGDALSSSLVDLSRTEMQTDEADVISEADIYIAYGRYREAEDLLREGISHSPDRLDLKFKLAEAYVGSRKHADLNSLLDQMRADGADRASPEQWQRLVEMVERTSGGASPERPSASAPAVAGRSEQAMGTGATEALSLDISDGGGPSLDLGEPASETARYSAPAPPPLSAAPRPAERPAPGEIEIGSEELSSPLDLDIGSDHLDMGLDVEPVGESASRAGEEPSVDDLAMTETELDMGALPGASELNIDSLLDSHDAETMEIESLMELDTPPPPKVGGAPLRPVTTTMATQQTPVTDMPVTGIAAESPSSDLLSSQWQMDSGHWDETATKLDLARAYVDMGDSDAARGILEEVVAEGNDEQRTEAKSLLAKIS